MTWVYLKGETPPMVRTLGVVLKESPSRREASRNARPMFSLLEKQRHVPAMLGTSKVNYHGKSRWVTGTITRVNKGNGAYDVAYMHGGNDRKAGLGESKNQPGFLGKALGSQREAQRMLFEPRVV